MGGFYFEGENEIVICFEPRNDCVRVCDVSIYFVPLAPS